MAFETLGMDVSRETAERLEIYRQLLEKWTKRINLVAPDTVQTAATRHFQDSAQLLHHVPQEPEAWVDLGSGGGFPGMVVAIVGFGMGWGTRFTLIESDQRKAAFLRTVSRETGVAVSVLVARAEQAPEAAADVVSARALAPLPRLLPLVRRHLRPNGMALLPKGRNYQQELEEVRDNHAFSLDIYPSETDSEAVILKIGDIRDV